MKLEQERCIFHQWWSIPICRKYIEDIDFNKIPDWYRYFRLWYKYLHKLLEPTRVDLQKFKVTKREQEGGWKIHQSRSWSNCRRSTADIDFSRVPDWSRDFRHWWKYLFELLEPTKVDLQLLNFAKRGQEGGWIFHQWRSWPLCTKSIPDNDFSQALNWSRDLNLWLMYLSELLEPTRVALQKFKVTKLGHEGGWIFHQWCFRPICRRYIVDIDFRQILNWSRVFRLWCKYLYKVR